MSDLSIAEQVYGQLVNESNPIDHLDGTTLPETALPENHPPGHDVELGLDLQGFACAYGMAWVIARPESPLAHEGEIERRAKEAAADAFRGFSTVGGREADKVAA
jgi:hypothetical protein